MRLLGRLDELAFVARRLLTEPVGPEAGEWLQQAALAIRARVPLDILRDTIEPLPTFSEIYLASLKALHAEIATTQRVAGVAS